MFDLNIKPTHKPIKTYYAELERYAQLGEENEGTVRAAFQNVLQHYCYHSDFTLLCEKTRSLSSDTEGSAQIALNRRIRPDGEVVDVFGLPHGYWEAKDTHDALYMACGSLRIQGDGAGTRREVGGTHRNGTPKQSALPRGVHRFSSAVPSLY